MVKGKDRAEGDKIVGSQLGAERHGTGYRRPKAKPATKIEKSEVVGTGETAQLLQAMIATVTDTVPTVEVAPDTDSADAIITDAVNLKNAVKTYSNIGITEEDLSEYDKIKLRIAKMPPDSRKKFVKGNAKLLLKLKNHWPSIRRPKQTPPKGDWGTWVYLAGRGSGKTRAGAEFIVDCLQANPGTTAAVIGQTARDCYRSCIEGESGIIAAAERRGISVSTDVRSGQISLKLPNGKEGIVYVYGAETYGGAIGKNLCALWLDEFATWPEFYKQVSPLEIYHRLSFCVRVAPAKIFISTTPRKHLVTGNSALDYIIKQEGSVLTRGSSFENVANLDVNARKRLENSLGSATGREEIFADLDIGISLGFDINWIKIDHLVPRLDKICVSIDPQKRDEGEGDETGIIVVGYNEDQNKYFVLQDSSKRFSKTNQIVEVTAFLALKYGATHVAVEITQGGDWVLNEFKSAIIGPQIIPVSPTKSKHVRAQAIVDMYENGQIIHQSDFKDLIEELRSHGNQNRSPNRLDALIQAIQTLAVPTSYIPRATMEEKFTNLFNYWL